LSLLFILFFFFQSCNIREREDSLQKKEALLNEKELQLLLREKNQATGEPIRLLNESVLSGSIIMILVTCTISSFIVEKAS